MKLSAVVKLPQTTGISEDFLMLLGVGVVKTFVYTVCPVGI